jgi:glycosyltransferase involved in cell wall biosynthesis
LKILYFASTSHPLVAYEAEELRKLGVSIDVTPCRASRSHLLTIEGLKELGRRHASLGSIVAEITSMIGASPYNILRAIYLFLCLVQLAVVDREHDYDLVHAFVGYPAGYVASKYCMQVRKPLVVSIHGHDIEKQSPRYDQTLPMVKEALNRCDAVIARDEHHASLARNMLIEPGKVLEVPLSVDTRKFRPNVDGSELRERYGIGDDETVVLFGPRLEEIYRGDDFIRAASMVSRSARNIRYVLLGGGQATGDVTKLARDLCVTAIFTGPICFSEMPRFYNMCDIYCHPCAFGQGVSGLEALSSGKPVLGYDVSQVKIVDQKDGLLARPFDYADLASKLLWLINHSRERKEMGENGRNRIVSENDVRVVARQLVEAYEKTILGFRPTGEHHKDCAQGTA